MNRGEESGGSRSMGRQKGKALVGGEKYNTRNESFAYFVVLHTLNTRFACEAKEKAVARLYELLALQKRRRLLKYFYVLQ